GGCAHTTSRRQDRPRDQLSTVAAGWHGARARCYAVYAVVAHAGSMTRLTLARLSAARPTSAFQRLPSPTQTGRTRYTLQSVRPHGSTPAAGATLHSRQRRAAAPVKGKVSYGPGADAQPTVCHPRGALAGRLACPLWPALVRSRVPQQVRPRRRPLWAGSAGTRLSVHGRRGPHRFGSLAGDAGAHRGAG